MKRNRYFFLAFLAAAAVVSSCADRSPASEQAGSEPEETVSTISEPARTALDSLSALLVDEFRKYDLPHFNPGVSSAQDGYVAMWYTTKEESVNNSFGILFCCLGIKNTIDAMRHGNFEKLAQKEASFRHPLPCSFEEYFKWETPRWTLFENYYRKCVEAGEVEYFWKFQYAFFADAEYLLCYNPDVILKNAPEAQYQSFIRKCRICREAVKVLSAENPQFSSLLEFRKKQAEKYGVDDNRPFPDIPSAIKGYPKQYDYYQTIRHNLLTR